MIYTPKLKASASITLKNLSGAIGEPMTVTLDEVLKFIPVLIDSEKICAECEDTTRCQECFFNPDIKGDYKTELLTDLIDPAAFDEEFYREKCIPRTKPKKKKKTAPKLCKTCTSRVEKHRELMKKHRQAKIEHQLDSFNSISDLGWVQ